VLRDANVLDRGQAWKRSGCGAGRKQEQVVVLRRRESSRSRFAKVSQIVISRDGLEVSGSIEQASASVNWPKSRGKIERLAGHERGSQDQRT
jgi:hypothetical protein